MADLGVAGDGIEYPFHNAGQDWLVSWHAASSPPPDGKNHGAAGFCFTPDGQIVLVSAGGAAWEPPAGRPEEGESLRQTLEREVMEEACARVEDAVLVGFSRGACIRGLEKDLVIVRSLWWARVSLLPWEPHFEMSHRRLVPPEQALEQITVAPLVPTEDAPHWVTGLGAIFARFFQEALKVENGGR